MIQLVTRWSNINSGTYNLDGIERYAADVQREFASLGAQMSRIPLAPQEVIDLTGNVAQVPLADAIRFTQRADAPFKIFLCIHLDTVFAPEHPFQAPKRIDARTLRGPGVADAKGGLVVMLTALRALERSELAGNIGWDVLLNTDEEIGSPGSAPLLLEAAKQNQVGLVFEPALPDGSLVGARKGSGNFTLIVRGREAHAGRDFHLGRSAILALTEFIARLDAVQHDLPGVSINCGRVDGGGAVNVVPALAIGRFNIRVTHPQDQLAVERHFQQLIDSITRQREGISMQLHGGFHSPPKPLDPRSIRLFETLEVCGRELGLKLEVHPGGGTCDGNRLAVAGLPVVDTLGPRGGHLHSDQEYILADSLPERAKLTASLLLRIASGTMKF